MNIKKLTVTLQGPLWNIGAFEIEGIDVLNRWEEDAGKSEGSVTVTNLFVDENLDIFIKIAAPNRSVYTVTLSGEISDHNSEIEYVEKNLQVIKNGKLNILLSININDLHQ